jgi:hypothetical protein
MDKLFLLENDNSNRQKWEFEYTAGTVAAAARTQMKFREKRVDVWTAKKAEVMAKIRESGIDIDMSLADEMNMLSNNYNTLRASGPQLRIDPLLQAHLTEAHQKILEHTELVKKYDAWIQVLEANAEGRIKLRHSDWMFFFGR